VFKKDLEQLTADLKATSDEAAVVRRYANALAAKREVRWDFLPDPGFVVLTHLEGCPRVRKARKNGEGRQKGHAYCNPREAD